MRNVRKKKENEALLALLRSGMGRRKQIRPAVFADKSKYFRQQYKKTSRLEVEREE